MITDVVVVVPARDEQAGITACLTAVGAAAERAQAAYGVRVHVVVVLDDCRDGTAALVGGFPDVVAVPVTGRCVGAARATGTARGLLAAGVAPGAVWTAHTDADSVVPEHWLVSMLAAAAAGADAVFGTVVPDDDLAPHLRRAWSALHPLTEGHASVHGANLGVRGSAYAAVGGWRALTTGEDVDLAARLVDAGAVVVRSAGATVVTSSRHEARAPLGFAHYLDELGPAEATA